MVLEVLSVWGIPKINLLGIRLSKNKEKKKVRPKKVDV